MGFHLLSIFLLALSFKCTLGFHFVCYFTNWSVYRTAQNGIGKYSVEDIDPSLCTHLVYSFMVLDPVTLEIKVYDPWIDIDNRSIEKFTALKVRNPRLKTMVAIGGYKDSTDGTGKYSRLVSNAGSIQSFTESAVRFLEKYNFDGLDLDWEYLATAADRAGFANLVIALKKAFAPKKFLLSAAVSARPSAIDIGYDVPTLNENLDFLNVMAYDMHGYWESKADHHSPLRLRPWDTRSSDAAVKYWISKGFSSKKIIMGIPTYGRTWTLSSDIVTPPAPAVGAGPPGPVTNETGLMAYYEICSAIKNDGWKLFKDPDQASGPYAVSPNSPITWVGFDDKAITIAKTKYVMDNGLGGAMVWDMTTDDFRDTCGDGVYPIMKTISNAFMRK